MDNKITVRFLLFAGQRITCSMVKPLKEKITLQLSGYSYNFEYRFALIKGGENPEIEACYYVQIHDNSRLV